MVTDLRQFIEALALAVAALLPIVNPLGGAPIYLAKTIDLTPNQHAELASRVARNCALLLLASLLLGTYVPSNKDASSSSAQLRATRDASSAC